MIMRKPGIGGWLYYGDKKIKVPKGLESLGSKD